MLAWVNRAARSWTAVACVAALAAVPAFAEEERPDRSTKWVPSLAIKGGGGWQDHEADVSSMCEVGGIGDDFTGVANCTGPSAGNVPGPAPLRPTESGSDHSVFPFVGAELQLTTPAIEALPGRPSVFVGGRIDLAFPPTRNVANEGDATGVTIPALQQATGLISLPAISLNGVGSRTSSEIQRVTLGAGIGVAFPFRFLGRQMRVKPSANWITYDVDVEGTVIAGLKDDPPIGPPFGPNLREVELSGKDTIVVHGIGPGLELEMDVGHVAGFDASVFMGANAFYVVSDRDTTITAEETLTGDNLPDDTYTAEWNYEVEPWIYRGDIGVRFSYIGN